MKTRTYRILPLLLMLCLGAVFARGQTISGPKPVCRGQSGTYAVTPLNPNFHYVWSVTLPGNLTGSPTASTATINWSGSGTGIVTVKAYDAANALQGTGTYLVPSLPLPVPLITTQSRVACQSLADTLITNDLQLPGNPFILDDQNGCVKVCEGSEIVYNAAGSPGSTFTWAVTGAASFTVSGASCTVQWGPVGTGSVSVTETSSPGGCNGTKTICVDVIEKPHAEFYSQSEPGASFVSVCRNETVIFVDYSTGSAGSPILSWFWDFGDGNTFSASNGSPTQHQYTEPGTYTVTLTVKNACGCVNVATMEVEVRDQEGVKIACPSVVCGGATATYKLEPVIPCGKYIWEVQGGTPVGPNPLNPFISVVWDHVDETGFGYVTFDSNPCQVDCPGRTVIKVPVVLAHGTIKGPAVACANSQALFSLPEWPTTKFKWTVSSSLGATLIGTDQNNQIVLNTKGAETVTLYCKYTNTLLGCGGTAQMQVQVVTPEVITGPKIACLTKTAPYSLLYGHLGNWILTAPNGVKTYFNGVSSIAPVFSLVGTYTLSASGPSFCAPATVTIKVNPKPAAPVFITGPNNACANTPVKYTTGSPLPGTLFYWGITNGTVLPATGMQTYANFTATPDPSQIRVWRVTTGEAHCSSDTLTKSVIRPVVTASITGEASPCPSAAYAYNSNYNEGETYTWSVVPAEKGSVNGNANQPTVQILWNNAGGSADIKLRITKCGVDYFYTKTVQIRSVLPLTLSIPGTVCRDELVTATVTNPGVGGTVTWSWGDATPNTPGNPATHTYTAASPNTFSYSIGVTVAGAYGCPNINLTGSTNITVRPAPVASVSPAGALIVCPGQPNPTLTAALQSGFTPTTTLQWWNTAGALQTSCPPPYPCATFTPAAFGGYYVVAIGANGCSATSNIVTVNAGSCTPDPGPVCNIVPAPTVSASGSSFCGAVTFTGSTGGGGTPYGWTWTPGDPSATNVTQTATSWTGKYNVSGYKGMVYTVSFTDGTNVCTKKVAVGTLVPLAAGIGHTVTCNPSGNSYDVKVFDHSNYQPGYTPTQFSFAVNGGTPTVTTTPSINLTAIAGGTTYYIEEVVYFPGGSCVVKDTIVLPQTPVAAFDWGPKPEACLEQVAVQFVNNSTGLGLSNLWEFSPSVFNTAANPYYTFQLPTFPVKQATLKVTDEYGCTNSKTYTIGTIPPNLFGTLQPNGNNFCFGNPITLNYISNTGTSMPDTFAWKDNLTSLFTTLYPATPPSIQVYDPGAYWVRGTNKAQCYVETKPKVAVSFVIPPVAAITGDTNTCFKIPFTLNGFAGAGASYKWYRNGSLIPGATSETYTDGALTVGNFSYTLIVSTTTGSTTCSDTSKPFLVKVNGLPAAPNVSYAMVDCNNYELELTASSGVPGASYTWSSGAIGNPVTVQGGGPYRAYLTDGNGCRSHGDVYVPKDPRTYLWIFPSGCFTFCKPEMPKTLVGPVALFDQWEWWQGGGPDITGSGVVPDYTIFNSGEYNLNLDNGLCKALSDPMDVVVDNNCQPCEAAQYHIAGWSVVDCSREQMRPCCYYLVDLWLNNTTGQPLSVNVASSTGTMVPGGTMLGLGGGIYTFQLLPDVGFTGGVVTITITYTTYDVNGIPTRYMCDDQVQLSGCIGPRARMAANGVSGALSDGGTDGTAMVLVPNPATTSTRIDYKLAAGTKGATIELFDLMGRRVASQQVTEQVGNWTVDLASLPAGTYLVLLRQSAGATLKTKLVVTH